MTYESLLVHEIYKQTAYSSQNQLGEWEFSYSSSSTPISCRLVPLTASERIESAGKYDDVTYKCFVKYSTSISPGDRVTYNSEDYRVKEVIADSESHHKRLYLAKL